MFVWTAVFLFLVLLFALTASLTVALALQHHRRTSRGAQPYAIIHCQWNDEEIRQFTGTSVVRDAPAAEGTGAAGAAA